MSVGTLVDSLETRNGKPAHVTFRTVEKHMAKRSEKEGKYVSQDVHVAEVRQLGSVDSVIWEVEKWFEHNDQEVRAERLNPAHAEYYRKAYERWKEGQEDPIEGTPIKSWPVLTPSQVGNLLHMGLRTVEDLATLNDEGVRRVGIGGVDLKNKAKAWLAASQDKGKLTQEMASLQRKADMQEATITTLQAQLDELKKAIKVSAEVRETDREISASDLIEEEEPRRTYTPKKPR